ncbi:MAG: hypothetical protein ACPL1F_05740, partial [bacterium]
MNYILNNLINKQNIINSKLNEIIKKDKILKNQINYFIKNKKIILLDLYLSKLNDFCKQNNNL